MCYGLLQKILRMSLIEYAYGSISDTILIWVDGRFAAQYNDKPNAFSRDFPLLLLCACTVGDTHQVEKSTKLGRQGELVKGWMREQVHELFTLLSRAKVVISRCQHGRSHSIFAS